MVRSWWRLLLVSGLVWQDVTSLSTKQVPIAGRVALARRRIRQGTLDTSETVRLVEELHRESQDVQAVESLCLEAFKVMDRTSNHQEALVLYKLCPTEAVRAQVISGVGTTDLLAALSLFEEANRIGSPSLNAILAVCARHKEWKRASALLYDNTDLTSTLSCNIALTAMERAKQDDVARSMLRTMLQGMVLPRPDLESFHRVMRTLIATSKVDEAYCLIGDMAAISVRPNQNTFDMLARAYGKNSDWTMVHAVESLRDTGNLSTVVDPDELRKRPLASESSNLHLYWESQDNGLQKEGVGKSAMWRFGEYQSIHGPLTVALQPHRNPSKNGIKIVLLDNSGRKIGFLLMINRADSNSSLLLGLFLDPSLRKAGLSKVLLAIWLDLCLKANLEPRTGAINKPLLAYVLQKTFGFVVRDVRKPGVLVEMSGSIHRPEQDLVELYGPSQRSLHGAFAGWDLQRERIRMLMKPPNPRGTMFRVGAELCVSPDCDLASVIKAALDSRLVGTIRVGFCSTSSSTSWRSIFLGNKA